MTKANNPACIITGANGGIGQSLVNVFQDQGYSVIATDHHPETNNIKCNHYIQADLAQVIRDKDYANNFFAEIHEQLNGHGLSAIINNAAIQILGGTDELTLDDWHKTLDVNLLAPFLLSKRLLPELERTTGCILNISSIHARLTKKNFVAYATSKSALSGMTRAMAVDLGNRVRVNAIEPAAIETDMLKAGFSGKAEQYKQLKDCHPQKRIGHADEVAKLALAIIDGDMKFLHGSCIGLDGGISSRLFDPD